MLLARVLGCPHAHCKIKSIDLTPPRKMPGRGQVHGDEGVEGNEVRWAGDPIAAVAGESEGAVAEGLKAIKVEYEPLDIFVKDKDLAAAEAAKRTGKPAKKCSSRRKPATTPTRTSSPTKRSPGCSKKSDVVVEGNYGIDVITHMCLEPHGANLQWDGDKLNAYLSTQNVSGTAGQFATPLGLTAGDVTVICDFIGGGFGSKFQVDNFNVTAAKIAKEVGRPVKLMLDRDVELKTAGCRPSGYINVKVGADKDGVVKVWDSQHWGTFGATARRRRSRRDPYVFNPKNRRRRGDPDHHQCQPVAGLASAESSARHRR